MSWLDHKYVAGITRGLSTVVGDIGNRYQEILMADATIKPGDTLPVTSEMAHEIAMEAGRAELERAMDPPEHEPSMDYDI
jgi:hypothetical protein